MKEKITKWYYPNGSEVIINEINMCSAKNKIRGNSNERRAVKTFTDAGIHAVRTWGSDGRSQGYHQEVDIIVAPEANFWPSNSKFTLQAKKKKQLPKYLGMSEHVDGVIFSEDYGKQYIIFELNYFIKRFLK